MSHGRHADPARLSRSTRAKLLVDEVAIAAKDGRPIRIGISVSYLRRGERPAGDRRGAIDATEEAIDVMTRSRT
jgi:hypothetical protein